MQAISIEAANPRHEHEWEDSKTIRIPDDKILIPGVIDSTTNFVEHPRLVAQRIGHYADIVGRERVIAGVDCGFGTAVRADPMVRRQHRLGEIAGAQRRRGDRQRAPVAEERGVDLAQRRHPFRATLPWRGRVDRLSAAKAVGVG